jgi:hypothetical protein
LHTGVAIDPGFTINVNDESGLRLGTPRRLLDPVLGIDGWAVSVTRAPFQGEDVPYPVITIGNLSVTGQILPGVDYNIVVSGTRIASNEQEVRTLVGQGLAGGLQNLHFLTFTSTPYIGAVIRHYGGGILADLPPAPEVIEVPAPPIIVEVPAPQPVVYRFNEFTPAIHGVANPFRFETNVEGNLVGFMSLRAFAYMLGSTGDQISWNQATNTATVTGTHLHGHDVTVTVTPGNPRAQVTGIPGTVDIAEFAGASGPIGTISPINIGGTVFLPLRFVTNAFGYEVTLEGGMVTFRR